MKPQNSDIAKIEVSPGITVVDADAETVVQTSAEFVASGLTTHKPVIVSAVHVGGLNARKQKDYLWALTQVDLAYADGAAVVLLARLGGAQHIERAATTDIGVPIIDRVASLTNKRVKVALIGGPPGLSESAGKTLSTSALCDVVFTTHGYHNDSEWDSVLAEASEKQPDVVLVGLGAPQEMIFCAEHKSSLPNSLIMTCGGWFGFLAGEEQRAPEWMQTAGLEWLHRVSLSPKRLTTRYGKGLVTVAVLAGGILKNRVLGK